MKHPLRSLALVAAASTFTGQEARADVVFGQSILRIVTDDANDDITVNVGPAAGQVEVVGAGPGSGTYFGVRGVIATTFGGDDVINVLGSSPFLPRIITDLGADKGTVNVDFTFVDTGLFDRNIAGVGVRTRGADDDVTVKISAANLPTRAIVDVDLGDGNNDLVVDLDPESTAPRLDLEGRVRGGDGIDSFSFDAGDDADVVTVDVSGDTGGGNDVVDVDLVSRAGGSTALTFDLDLGGGRDILDADGSGSDLTVGGAVRGGAGPDTLEVETQEALSAGGGIRLEGGTGNDDLELKSAGSNRSASVLEGGPGDDDVDVLVQNGDLQTPTFSDGGPGFDEFFGIGAIANFEDVDRL